MVKLIAIITLVLVVPASAQFAPGNCMTFGTYSTCTVYTGGKTCITTCTQVGTYRSCTTQCY